MTAVTIFRRSLLSSVAKGLLRSLCQCKCKILKSISFHHAVRRSKVKFLLTYMANRNIVIAISNMKLGEKLRYLRLMEGNLRGFGREMTQQEVVKAVARDLKMKISQSYLSQIENGARPHLTNKTRLLLAKFFNVHPGYLVDDPEGFHNELISDVSAAEDTLDLWLIQGAERFRRDPPVSRALLNLAKHKDSRSCLVLMEAILETPELAEKLLHVLRPQQQKSAPEMSQA
jgi:transcriptional regulator with XRE-family HTH domain